MALPKFALMFYTNAVVRNFLIVPEDQQSRPNYGSVFLSGAMSQILVVPLIVAPLERIKVKLHVSHVVAEEFKPNISGYHAN